MLKWFLRTLMICSHATCSKGGAKNWFFFLFPLRQTCGTHNIYRNPQKGKKKRKTNNIHIKNRAKGNKRSADEEKKHEVWSASPGSSQVSWEYVILRAASEGDEGEGLIMISHRKVINQLHVRRTRALHNFFFSLAYSGSLDEDPRRGCLLHGNRRKGEAFVPCCNVLHNCSRQLAIFLSVYLFSFYQNWTVDIGLRVQ